MSENILVAVAWPYANADIHVGNIVGAYLPADIYARYHRLAGNQVLMVSGSDAHGTPVTVRADAEGTTSQAVYERFHGRFLELFQKLGLHYDLFTSTHTDNHFRISQDILLALKEHGALKVEGEIGAKSAGQVIVHAILINVLNLRRCAFSGTSGSGELATKGTAILASLTMILLATPLCNYGRGFCLIDVGTEGYTISAQGISSGIAV